MYSALFTLSTAHGLPQPFYSSDKKLCTYFNSIDNVCVYVHLLPRSFLIVLEHRVGVVLRVCLKKKKKREVHEFNYIWHAEY